MLIRRSSGWRRSTASEHQLLLRWAVQKGYPILPKATNPEQMRRNRDLFGFRIDDADMASVATMDRGGLGVPTTPLVGVTVTAGAALWRAAPASS